MDNQINDAPKKRRKKSKLSEANKALLAKGIVFLSDREIQILQLIERGYSNREIAEHAKLSHFTIEDYTKVIYRKLAVGSRTAAVYAAKARGLLH